MRPTHRSRAIAKNFFLYPPDLQTRSEKQNWFLLTAGLLLTLFLSFCIFIYNDILDTFDGSVLLLEAILQGKLQTFYQYAAENSADSTVYTANYNVLMYAIFLLWNLPAALLHVFRDFSYLGNIFAVLWCKAIIPMSLFLCAQGIWCILREFSVDRKDCYKGSFLFLSSMCVFLGALCASQYDSIMMCFEIWGLYCFIRRKDTWFLILFAIAIPLKLFSVFLLLPLLCIRHKKITKVLFLLALAFIPNVLLGIPFRNDIYYHAALNSQNRDALALLFDTSVTGGVLSAFVIVFLIVSIWCFFRNTPREEEAYFAVYVAFLVFAAFVAFVPIRSYWILLFVPFGSILIMSNKRNRVLGVLLETIGGICGVVYYLIRHWIYQGAVRIRIPILPNDPAEGMEYTYGGLAALIDSFGFSPYKDLFLWGFVVCLMVLAFIYFPRKVPVSANAGGQLFPNMENHLLYWRLVSILAVISLMLYAGLATRPVISYGSDQWLDTTDSVNLLTQEYSWSGICFNEDRTLTEFGALITCTDNARANRSMLHFTLIEEGSGQILWRESLPVHLIENDSYNTVRMEHVPVKMNSTYRLEVRSSLLRNEENNILLLLAQDGQPAIFFR